MRLGNSTERWGAVSMLLHWLVAVLVFALLAAGFVMESGLIQDRTTLFALYQAHKSFGLLVLVLAALRLVWRLFFPVPILPGTLKPWEKRLAGVTHIALYGLLFAQPLVGWLMVSASPLQIPTVAFGVIEVPHLIGPDKVTENALKAVHGLLAWALMAVVALHLVAALKHHLVLRDDVLRRMLPARRPNERQ